MWEYFLVFLGAAIPWLEMALVIPLGIVSGLNPLWVVIIGFIGNMVTVMALIIGYDRFRSWLAKRNEGKEEKESKRSERAKRIWNKYGLPGMLMLGPILIGTHIAAFIGMTLGASKKQTTIWSVISIALWALVFGILTALGFDFFVREI
ncbi:small multi-drug export protein [Paenisporosarcina quisquiliarum]|uniref:Small multi-drug export protein n=1 Tax=Paenisporosarcina quisquiliarum TaxID=365346 RepID=A0A9X3RCC5_9BACL|nr:small multi-drug export protein [Paenisporosarcina quisquiliarum]MCZ8536236.1 small multi-drug export protein [Paenisporosarcina quisquiliarum]